MTPREGRADRGVLEHGDGAGALGVGLELHLLGGLEGGLGAGELGGRFEVVGLGEIDLLAGHEPGLLGGNVLDALEGEVGHIRAGLGACDASLRGDDVGASGGEAGGGLGHLILELGDFEGGEKVALVNMIANVDADGLDVTGDLGHDIDVLVGSELGGEDELAGEVGRLGGRGGNGESVRGGDGGLAAGGQGAGGREGDGEEQGVSQRGWHERRVLVEFRVLSFRLFGLRILALGDEVHRAR